jgi:hypothetical protein
MFRALLCPSSGARDYVSSSVRCVVPKMLVVGWQVQGSRLSVQRERDEGRLDAGGRLARAGQQVKRPERER